VTEAVAQAVIQFLDFCRTAEKERCVLRLEGLQPEVWAFTFRDRGSASTASHLRCGCLAARPSGTENIYKLYAESLKSAEHLTAIVEQTQEIVSRSLGGK